MAEQTFVDTVMAVVGYLLYGDMLKDELTTNMIGTEAYYKKESR